MTHVFLFSHYAPFLFYQRISVFMTRSRCVTCLLIQSVHIKLFGALVRYFATFTTPWRNSCWLCGQWCWNVHSDSFIYVCMYVGKWVCKYPERKFISLKVRNFTLLFYDKSELYMFVYLFYTLVVVSCSEKRIETKV